MDMQSVIKRSDDRPAYPSSSPIRQQQQPLPSSTPESASPPSNSNNSFVFYLDGSHFMDLNLQEASSSSLSLSKQAEAANDAASPSATNRQNPTTSTTSTAAAASASGSGTDGVHVKVREQLINAINSAYMSSGYPKVVGTGTTRGQVYGAFVDLRNPIVGSVPFPPTESYIMLANKPFGAGLSSSFSSGTHTPIASPQPQSTRPTFVDPSARVSNQAHYLAIRWHVVDNMLAQAGANNNSAVFQSGSAPQSSTLLPSPLTSPTGTTAAFAGSGGAAQQPAIGPRGSVSSTKLPPPPSTPMGLQGYLHLYPDGIHNINSSVNMTYIAGVEGAVYTPVPTAAEEAAMAAAAAGNSGGVGQGSTSGGVPTAFELNLPTSPTSDPTPGAPVQRSLVLVNSYNHLSTYVVHHQGPTITDVHPIQTLSVSLASRKVTTATSFFLCRDDSRRNVDNSSKSDNQAVRVDYTAPAALRHSSSAVGGPSASESVPIVLLPKGAPNHSSPAVQIGSGDELGGGGGGIRSRSPSTHGQGWDDTAQQRQTADATLKSVTFEPISLDNTRNVEKGRAADPKEGNEIRRPRTGFAAKIDLSVEPFMLIGNQRGDLLVYSILQEQVVHRLNYGGAEPPSQTASPSTSPPPSDKTLAHSVSQMLKSPNSHSSFGGGSTSPNKNGTLLNDPMFANSQIVNSPVSRIVELTSCAEEYISSYLQYARIANGSGAHSFRLPNLAQAPVSSFAVGFDNGRILLVAVSSDRAYVHHSINHMGFRPISEVVPRQPNLFVRLWPTFMYAVSEQTNGGEPNTNNNGAQNAQSFGGLLPTTGPIRDASPTTPSAATRSSGKPTQTSDEAAQLTVPPSWAVISELHIGEIDDCPIAAVASDGGVISIVRLPQIEIVARTHTAKCNSYGEVLTMEWVPSTFSRYAGNRADLLAVSVEDDSVLIFQVHVADDEDHLLLYHQTHRQHGPTQQPPPGNRPGSPLGSPTARNAPKRFVDERGVNAMGNAESIRETHVLVRPDAYDTISAHYALSRRGQGHGLTSGIASESTENFMGMTSPNLNATTASRSLSFPVVGGLATTMSTSTECPRFPGVVLQLVQRITHHKSWVNNMSTMPLYRTVRLSNLLSSCGYRAGTNGTANTKQSAECVTVQDNVLEWRGLTLASTSYDGETSFWTVKKKMVAHDQPPRAGSAANSGASSNEPARRAVGRLGNRPVASVAMDEDLAVNVVHSGAGFSHFAVSVSCRGVVKFWEIKDKS